MKKKLLSALLVLAMILTMIPTAFAAEVDTATSSNDLVPSEDKAAENAVAETEVTTAEELKNEIGEGTSLIVLKNDITLTDKLVVDKPVTIDGKGNTITGTVELKNGTVRNTTFTNEEKKEILTIGNTEKTTINLLGCTVLYPSGAITSSGQRDTISHTLEGNVSTINIKNSKFTNNGRSETEWSYGLYFGSNSGTINFENNTFDGTFRTMLPSINGNVNIIGNTFINYLGEIQYGSQNGAYDTCTAITTGTADQNHFVINNNTFTDAGCFFFQKLPAEMTGNTFNLTLEGNYPYFQVRASTACGDLNLNGNTFNLGNQCYFTYETPGGKVILPAGVPAIHSWMYADVGTKVGDSHENYAYTYLENGKIQFNTGSKTALTAILTDANGNWGVQDGDVINLTQDITLNKAIPLNRSVTINGNNHVLSSVDNTQNLQGCIFTIQKPDSNIQESDITVKLDQVNLLIQTENAKPFYFTQNNGSMNFEMTNSKISCASDKNAYLINLVQGGKVKYNFVGNEVTVPARGLLVSIVNGSVIKDNVIDLQGEKSPTGRSGIMALVAAKGGDSVTITGNTFKNANRALGVDHSDLEAARLTYNQNKFLNVRFALEFDPSAESANAGTGTYDLNRNYYSFDGKVSAPKVEDASSKEDHLTGATEYKPEGESRVDNSVYYVAETMRDPQDLNNYTPPVTGGSSSGNKTETTVNPDGSTTTTVTKPDGTITTTTTDKEGNKTETVEKPDGSSVTKVENKDGSGSTTTVSKDGKAETVVKVPRSVIEGAKGNAVPLPMPETETAKDADKAPSVTVDLPNGETAKVEVPVKDVTAGTVAVLVKKDGTEEIIKTTAMSENGVIVTLSDGDTIKIVDNSKDFVDVADSAWYADEVDFVTSRELFSGTSATTFSPNAAMTRAMIVTVLARLDGVDTNGGETWYEIGRKWAMENGISDGSGMMDDLTREQLVAMLWRYAGSPTSTKSLAAFKDAGTVSGYAKDAFSWAVEQGIIAGVTADALQPQGNATRAQVAAILMRFCENIAK